ncbi:hypothetical protein PHMEG_00065 [Phytophthora megakarya]|uniref:CFA20 domain-containing protein n=1 Tax=Phytophthora megakarya TaxID=4795 RepID=A0A225X4B6_9STRA|nr:hypothetical protein PHMEG_00065 [Phytophthora megakarya]
MAYFHGGDFVELLSAQGKAPAASWKLQGKISKTFDKGIKGNAFTLDGHSGTKMQLPKTTSSSLGLAQRFVILQLLVPFTRSFSVEICYSDFHKIRRRFMVASAFRDITRTALHVQLPLNAVEIPRDQWMNLVFDLHTLSEMHFPGTGYRSMESVCVSGSCRLKRIFTMKDAPTPSQGANVVRHADIRDIPRQFVFSATQRGISDASPIPTLYFPTMPGSGIAGIGGVHGVTVVSTNAVVNGNQKSSRRGGTALATKLLATGTRPVRQTTVLLHHNTLSQPQSVTPDMDADKPSGQRLQTPARVNTTSSKRRQLKSSQGKVVVQRDAELSSPRLHVSTSPHKYTFESTPKIYTLRSKSPIRLNKSQEVKQEEIMDAVPPAPTMSPRSLDRALTPPNSLHSSVMVSPNEKPELRSQTLRQSIMGEIQQKIASLEADDERADQRDRELFLRHTSLHSGEWHLQKLRDDDFDDDGALLSDDESDLELSSSWRREMPEQYPKKYYPDDTMANTSVVSRFDAGKEFPFSFSSVEPRTTAQKSTSRLLDFDSLLQDVEPLTAPQTTSRTETEPHLYEQLEKRIDSALTDTEIDADDMDLTKLLAAKRSTKQLAHTQNIDREANVNTEKKLSNPSEATPIIENDSNELKEDSHDLALQCYEDIADIRGERDNWVVVKKNTADPVCDTKHIELSTDACEAIQENVDRQSTRDEDSDIDFSGDVTGLSMDL